MVSRSLTLRFTRQEAQIHAYATSDLPRCAFKAASCYWILSGYTVLPERCRETDRGLMSYYLCPNGAYTTLPGLRPVRRPPGQAHNVVVNEHWADIMPAPKKLTAYRLPLCARFADGSGGHWQVSAVARDMAHCVPWELSLGSLYM